MEEAKPKADLLYSPRQIEIATFLASPSAIYMLVKNYNVLEKDEYSRNVKYIGSLVFVLYLFTALYIHYEVPTTILQGIPVFFVWAILQKHHMTKEEIIMLSPFNFQSNWKVILVAIPALIVSLCVTFILTLPPYLIYIFDGGQSSVVWKNPDKPEGSYEILEISPPHYDPYLRAEGVEGWVVVEFSLDESGKVDSAKVREESPIGVFSEAAIESVKKSIFKPASKDGLNQRTENVLLKLTFKMADDTNEINCDSILPDDERLTSCSQVQ
jgi:TonB family protein